MGCKVTDKDGVTRIYRYVNESGVEVALVGQPSGNYKIPDSLVVQDGNTFECSFGYSYLHHVENKFPYNLGGPTTYPSTPYIPIKIYFNKNIRVVYTYKDYTARNPMFVEQIGPKKKKHKKIYTYTYTFTAEDYQNAIKAQ